MHPWLSCLVNWAQSARPSVCLMWYRSVCVRSTPSSLQNAWRLISARLSSCILSLYLWAACLKAYWYSERAPRRVSVWMGSVPELDTVACLHRSECMWHSQTLGSEKWLKSTCFTVCILLVWETSSQSLFTTSYSCHLSFHGTTWLKNQEHLNISFISAILSAETKLFSSFMKWCGLSFCICVAVIGWWRKLFWPMT